MIHMTGIFAAAMILTSAAAFSLGASESQVKVFSEEFRISVPIECKGYRYEDGDYKIVKTSLSPCLLEGDQKVCETKWNKKINGMRSLTLEQNEKVEYRNFFVRKEITRLSDGSTRAQCPLVFQMKFRGKEADCTYDRITKDIAIFCTQK